MLTSFAKVKYGFILLWGIVSSLVLWKFQKWDTNLSLVLFLLLTLGFIIIIFAVSFLAFLDGWWLPFVPAILEVMLVTFGISIVILSDKITSYKKLLEDLESAHGKILAGQRQKILSQLVSGVAHEINNPLNFVENYTEFSQEWLNNLRQSLIGLAAANQLRQEDLENFEQILNNINDNLEEIINYSQKASSISHLLLRQTSSKQTEPSIVDVNKLIVSVLEICCYSRSKERNCYVNRQTQLDTNLGKRLIPAEELTQCLINLINNACDAAIDKKELIEGDFQPTVLVKSGIVEDEALEIEIIDNGVGIIQEIASSLFNPFFTTKQHGTGLGLYMSQQAIQKYGGNISWHCIDEKTYFKVVLPKIIQER
jgi:signal transduction histidine kinase